MNNPSNIKFANFIFRRRMLLLQNMCHETFLAFKIDSPLSDVSMRAFIQVENICSIYCKLQLDKQQEVNGYCTGSVYFNCIMSAIGTILQC